MKPFLRKITVFFFFALFLILAPLLTAYSLGYRYDFKTGNIQKNGAFYIKSYPKGGEIFIDNKKRAQKTPTQIVNILPGVHKVEVKKENYVPWVKNLEVFSGETTFAEDIVLFSENRSQTHLGKGSENILLNKNKDKYALIDQDNLLIITDVEQAKTIDIEKLDKNYELIDWSSDNQSILLKDEKNYFSFDINQKNIEAIVIDDIEKILWENGSDTMIYLKEGNLYKHYNRAAWSSAGPADQLLNIPYAINDFDIKDNWIIIQYTDNENNFVDQLDKTTLQSKQNIKNVNLGNLDVLLAQNNTLIFSLGSTLYIKNEFQDLISIPSTIAKIHDERLLLTNGHEIILYNFKEDWQNLIDRSSNIVSDVFWHPNGSYFISEINDHTVLTEIDGRDRRNNIELINNPRKKNYVFDNKGEKLFVITPEENYYLTIQ